MASLSDDEPKWIYRAFISYSHKDAAWARRLHGWLEAFRVPSAIAGQPGRHGPIPLSLKPIFLDRSELPASGDLNGEVSVALGASQFLIVVCSPNAAASPWVNEEVLTFKRVHGDDRVLAIIIDGEPNASTTPNSAAEECFPPALRYRLTSSGSLSTEPANPIAADARPVGDGLKDAQLKLVAGLLGVGFDVLKLRAQRANIRRLTAIASVLGSLVVVAATGWIIAQLNGDAARERLVAAVKINQRVAEQAIELNRRLDLRGRGVRTLLSSAEDSFRELAKSAGDDSNLSASLARLLLTYAEFDLDQGEDAGTQAPRIEEALRSISALLESTADRREATLIEAHAAWLRGALYMQHGAVAKCEAELAKAKRLLQGASDAASRSLLAAIEVTLGRIALTTEFEKRERSDNAGADHDLTLARRSFETAVQLGHELLRKSPNDPGVLRQLALAHIAHGDALSQRGCAQGPCLDALASYNAGLSVLDSFSLDRKAERADLSYARFLVLFARAALLSDMKRHDDALADINQAEAIIRVLSALDVDNRQWGADVGKTLLTKGRYEDAAGHVDRAAAAYAEACTLLGALLRVGLDHADWASDYEACKEEQGMILKLTPRQR